MKKEKSLNPFTNPFNWYGWSNPKAGYGIVNLEYSTALQRVGANISYVWEREKHLDDSDFVMLTSEQKEMLTKPYNIEKIGIIKTTPQMFFMNKSDYRIGYTMVENTRIGERWTQLCNEMDAMFVPSQFLVQVFQDCGIVKPIKVVKQGIDTRKFPYKEREIKDKFIFGTIGYMDDRKNWEAMVAAFCSEFDQNEDVELWIKNSNSYFIWTGFADSRIKVINKIYSFDDIVKLYYMFDCFLCPSHAEGSGLTPREAMATGIPSINTNWSGLTEISDPEISFPLTPVSITHPDVRGAEQPGFQAEIDVTELMYWMRYAYEHRDVVKEKGKKASDFVRKNYDWEVCAHNLLSKLEELNHG